MTSIVTLIHQLMQEVITGIFPPSTSLRDQEGLHLRVCIYPILKRKHVALRVALF